MTAARTVAGKFGRIRPLRALLHIGELITQRGDAALGKSVRDLRHKGVHHTGPRTMC